MSNVNINHLKHIIENWTRINNEAENLETLKDRYNASDEEIRKIFEREINKDLRKIRETIINGLREDIKEIVIKKYHDPTRERLNLKIRLKTFHDLEYPENYTNPYAGRDTLTLNNVVSVKEKDNEFEFNKFEDSKFRTIRIHKRWIKRIEIEWI